MKKIFFGLFLCASFLLAEGEEVQTQEGGTKLNSADCLILQDENSIICKYLHERAEEDVEVTIQWLNPSGEVERERTLVIPAGHGSIYDFRYIEGRMEGTWQFKVIEGENEASTSFTIE